ncbi:unnamed protein product [Parnassius apollo]|uniref:(apollo) hypothetical protein n=1 Tax=Parnassius apollo TaxID=110799 RepID=A0A8S3XWZ7_PARAO|nr:unnamed protein product [Parnassius apollo]
MTCKGFKKFLENLQLNDNSKAPAKTSNEYDKLYKVRPVLEMLNNACQREAKRTTSQFIDEAMIRFKGVSSLKQYMPAKPIKRGFKDVNFESSLVQKQQQLEIESKPPELVDVHASELCISHTAPTSTPESYPTLAVSVAPANNKEDNAVNVPVLFKKKQKGLG